MFKIKLLQYYCEQCWASIHSRPGREFHKPLVKEGADRLVFPSIVFVFVLTFVFVFVFVLTFVFVFVLTFVSVFVFLFVFVFTFVFVFVFVFVFLSTFVFVFVFCSKTLYFQAKSSSLQMVLEASHKNTRTISHSWMVCCTN